MWDPPQISQRAAHLKTGWSGKGTHFQIKLEIQYDSNKYGYF